MPATPGKLDPTVAHHDAPSLLADAGSESEKLDWAQIANQLPFGLVVLGPGQELRHENEVCREMLGATVRKAGGIEGWLTLLCPDENHCERVIDSFREHVWRNQLTRTFSLRSTKGKLREIEFRSSLHPDGGITIVLQDVTDTLRAQEVQRHGKMKFRALFAGTDNGAVLTDRTGRIIDANPAFLELVRLSLREIRMSAFSDLLNPEDAGQLAAAEHDFIHAAEGIDELAPELNVRLRSGDGETQTRLSFHPVGEKRNDPSLTLYLTGGGNGGHVEALSERLQLVARKAKSLLDSVPDLIFLIDPDLTVADFAPPPNPWKELEMHDSWRGQKVQAIWPALGELLSEPRRELIDQGKIVHADLLSQRDGLAEFAVTLSTAGDGQILAVVRNQSPLRQARHEKERISRAFEHIGNPAVIVDGSGKILAANAGIRKLVGDSGNRLVNQPLTALLDETSCMLVAQHLPVGNIEGKTAALFASIKRHEAAPLETTLEICSLSNPEEALSFALYIRGETSGSSGRTGFSTEKSQHHFRNQLQMVTSLFSMESRDNLSDVNSLKWQLRLRSLACAIPGDGEIRLGALIRQVTDEAARLMQLGPGERLVSIDGPDNLEVSLERATPLALLVGELIRLAVDHRKPGSHPRLQFSFAPTDGEETGIEFLAENLQPSRFPEDQTGTIQVLTAQMGGRISGTVTGSGRGWIFSIPK